MFIRHQRSENSLATTLNSVAKFTCFLRELCPSIIIIWLCNSQYSPATPILNENPEDSNYILFTGKQYLTFEHLRPDN